MPEPSSALVVPIPEVGGAVEPWLERSARRKPSHGVPAHVTLLWPCPGDADGIRSALAGAAAFDVEFRALGRFAAGPTLYLAPEPAEPFVEATEALVARFPDWLPYGGAHGVIVPHLTVAQGETQEEAEATLAPLLPLRGRAREAVLLTQVEPLLWERRASFPFRES
jgi:hypothetical protein